MKILTHKRVINFQNFLTSKLKNLATHVKLECLSLQSCKALLKCHATVQLYVGSQKFKLMKLTSLFLIIFFIIFPNIEKKGQFDQPILSEITQPTIQTTNISSSYVSNTAISIQWENGNGEKRAVFIKEEGGINETPQPENGTLYSANTKFTYGAQIEETGWYCVYDGDGSSVTVTNFSQDTQYKFMVIEYNTEDNQKQYLTTTAVSNPVFFTTIDQQLILFPNFISPNGDNQNDTWVIQGIDQLEYFELNIYNNYGEKIFESDNYQNDWDATYNGKVVPDGTYYYIFSNDGIIYKGTITVIY